MRPLLYTVGHSDRSWSEFASLLRAHGIRRLVDIRRFPGSRRVPWTSSGRLKDALKRKGILYSHLPQLGGRRRARADSPNGAWRSPSFRGYADHMATEEFLDGIARLERYASKRRTAVMCAEAVPWRCHRGVLSDFWIAGGGAVMHIMTLTSARAHKLPPFARATCEGVVYPLIRGGDRPRARSRRPSRSSRRRPARAGSASRSAP